MKTKKHIKTTEKRPNTWLPWLLIVLGFLAAVILISIIIAVVSSHASVSPHAGLAEAVQHAQSAMIDLFVMAAAALLAVIRELWR